MKRRATWKVAAQDWYKLGGEAMEESMRIRPVMLALLATLSILPILAQDSEISFKSTQLAPGLYMLEGEGGFAGGNISLSTGEDGVVLIDDGLPPLTDILLAAIGELTEGPSINGDFFGG